MLDDFHSRLCLNICYQAGEKEINITDVYNLKMVMEVLTECSHGNVSLLSSWFVLCWMTSICMSKYYIIYGYQAGVKEINITDVMKMYNLKMVMEVLTECSHGNVSPFLDLKKDLRV